MSDREDNGRSWWRSIALGALVIVISFSGTLYILDYMDGQRRNVDLLIASNKMQPPGLTKSVEGLFAHAPSSLSLPVHAGDLRLGFGIRDAAWQGAEKTNGVCFVAKAGANILFQRCLNPASATADRGLQEAVVIIPANIGQVSLDTTCRENCAYDWSYWSSAVQN